MNLPKDFHESLFDIFSDYCEALDITGASFSLFAQGKIHGTNFGFEDEGQEIKYTSATRGAIGCVNKFLTSILVQRVSDRGQICLDDPIDRYFGDIPADIRSSMKAVTVSMLLSETHGLDEPFSGLEKVNYVSSLTSWLDAYQFPVLFEPGSLQNRGALGNRLAWRILEKLTGATVAELIKSEICDPLDILPPSSCMDSTVNGGGGIGGTGSSKNRYKIEGAIREAGDEMCFSSTELVRILATAIGVDANVTSLLSPAARERIFTPVFTPFLPASYYKSRCLGVDLLHNGLFGSAGSIDGQSTFVRIDLKSGVVMAMQCNRSPAFALPCAITEAFWGSEVDISEDLPRRGNGNRAGLGLTMPVAGLFETNNSSIHVTNEDGDWYAALKHKTGSYDGFHKLKPSGAGAYRLEPPPPASFMSSPTLHFVGGGDEPVASHICNCTFTWKRS